MSVSSKDILFGSRDLHTLSMGVLALTRGVNMGAANIASSIRWALQLMKAFRVRICSILIYCFEVKNWLFYKDISDVALIY